MGRIVFIAAIACAMLANAEIPLQLVAEIQLPARTITWDLQHYEDSTSFGWAAVTEGETYHELDTLITDADTIWFRTRLEDSLDYSLFPQSWMHVSQWSGGVRWSGLRLVSLADNVNPVVAARTVDYGDPIFDLHRYTLFSLQQDTIINRYFLWDVYEGGFRVNSADVWPSLPAETEWIGIGAEDHYTAYHGDHHVDGIGYLLTVHPFQSYSLYAFDFDLCERTSTPTFSFLGGYEVDDFFFHYRCGAGEYIDSLTVSVFDTISTNVPRHAVEQEDFDGTIRVLGPTGRCFSSFGNLLYEDTTLANVTLSAYIQSVRGEDWLEYRSNRLYVYDPATGALVDSTVTFLGTPSHTLLTSGYDQIVTFDDSTKVARVYEPVQTAQTLTIQWIAANRLELRWTAYRHATAYRLERSANPDFSNAVSDYFDSSVLSTEITPLNSKEFFKVTPVFE